MKNIVAILILIELFSSCREKRAGEPGMHDLLFTSLPKAWDEGIPLGNGMTGALVWQKDGRLRISIDRADLWDLRPMENIGIPEWKYKWVYEKWKTNNYGEVQEKFDAPYDRLAAPTKIPGAAIEFDISALGPVSRVWLDIAGAVCHVNWEQGGHLELFADASGGNGWYRFTGGPLPSAVIVPPAYVKTGAPGNPAGVISYGLERLGYEQGTVITGTNSSVYRQKAWGGFSYSVEVSWTSGKKETTGSWNISSYSGEGIGEKNSGNYQALSAAEKIAGENRAPSSAKKIATDNRPPSPEDYLEALKNHTAWWRNFWSASGLSLPDTLLERQWYLEMYKFGSAARADSPPISLQAVWTADNGQLPPWKGDFHHDLNTQLSYWPAYGSNHTDLAAGFTNWMWENRETFRKYTKEYFENEGINVPGVTTLAGEPMGGWIQYSFGPTVSAWLAHHFYLQWKYTSDTLFLTERAYPWISSVALHLDQLSVRDEKGLRKYPISSSPEFNDNSRDAWFADITNFDLSLTRWTFEKAAEMAAVLGLEKDRERWLTILSEWPQLAVDTETGLMIAPGQPYSESHRHFSHLMSVYPLGTMDISSSDAEKEIIEKSLRNLVLQGSDNWNGYSWAWLGNLYARAGKGAEAAKALRTFAECFCLPNSFHVNGDQSGTGKSKMTYRPFTLEGNFAFASGIQEMLLQSHRGMIEVFPAIPAEWKDVSFEKLRAEGAVLASATMKDGLITRISLIAEKGGNVYLKPVFGSRDFTSSAAYDKTPQGYMFTANPGEEIVLELKRR